MKDQNLDKNNNTNKEDFTRIEGKDVNTKNCDNCGKEIPSLSERCNLCGVEFNRREKFLLKSRIGGVDHLSDSDWAELERSWKKIAALYSDKEVHHAFLNLCYGKRALSYAIYRYGEIIKINAEDDVAQAMKRQALTISQEQLLKTKVKPNKQKLQVNVPTWPKYVSLFGLFSGAMLTVMGSLHMPLAEYVGMGIAICVVSLFTYFLSRAFN